MSGYRKQKRKKSALSRAWWFTMAGLLLCVVVLYVIKSTSTETTQTIPVKTDLNVQDRIARAEAILASDQVPAAEVVDKLDTGTQKLMLAFEGTPGPGVLDGLLELLSAHQVKATFFLSAVGAAEDASILQRILSEGHTLGSYGFNGEKHMDQLPQQEIVSNLCSANAVFYDLMKQEPTILRCNAANYTPALLQAAAACGYTNVYDTGYRLSYQSFSSYESVLSYVTARPYGSIISLKLSETLDEADIPITPEPEAAPTPTVPGTVTQTLPPDASAAKQELTPSERILQTATWLLDAMDHTNFTPEVLALREKNGGVLAVKSNEIHTTERSIAYLFFGLGNDEELDYLLHTLQDMEATGTFFVTWHEAQTCEDAITKILAHGHDLGVAVKPEVSGEFYCACSEILLCQKELAARYNYHNATVVKQPYGTIPDTLLEAVSATGTNLITHEGAVAQADNKEAVDPQQVIDALFNTNVLAFKRGESIYFAMNHFEKSNTMLGDLARMLHEQKNIYSIQSANALLSHTEYLYQYPVEESDMLPIHNGLIQAGHLEGMSEEERFELMRTHYVGNYDTRLKNKFPDFSNAQIRRLNIKGRIDTDENAIFFTFDDWGSDKIITRLLDVLDKHNVKATFYVRTNYTPHNPNLLRAMALAGHDIASHTDSHYPMATDDDGDGNYDELKPEEVIEFEQDVIKSYEVLKSIVGDMEVDGRPALSNTFRPPTLAISKNGSYAILDAGFSYIVAGDVSTHDYAAENAEEVYNTLKQEVRSGSVIVLHMSDTSKYTPEALDRFLTENEKKPEGQRFVPRRISDYLDGTYQTRR